MINKLAWNLTRSLAKYSSPLLSILEQGAVKKSHSKRKNVKHGLVFLVGAPRTGSTFLYQALTNTCAFLYLNNLIYLFHRNLYFGFQLSRKIWGDIEPHNCFISEFGNTLRCGWKAPNEGGNFWYNWLSRENNYTINNALEETKVKEIQEVLFTILYEFNKSLLFKNLYGGQRMPLIHKISSDANFIFMRRDPVYTVQSILMAKRRLGIPANKLWSIRPANYRKLEEMREIDQVVNQVHSLETQIYRDKKLFPEENFFEVRYEELVADAKNSLKKILDFLHIHRHQIPEIPTVSKGNHQQLPDEEFEEIQHKVNLLNWQPDVRKKR